MHAPLRCRVEDMHERVAGVRDDGVVVQAHRPRCRVRDQQQHVGAWHASRVEVGNADRVCSGIEVADAQIVFFGQVRREEPPGGRT